MTIENHFSQHASWSENDPDFARLWRDFLERFPSEEDCMEELCRMAYPNGFHCPHCNSEVSKEYGERTMTCRICKSTIWIFGGTLFEGMRLARPTLAAIWLRERGVSTNPFRFHRLLNIAYSSSYKLFKKLSMAVESEMQNEFISTHSRMLAPVIARRSRETPARSHPLAEIDLCEAENDEFTAAASTSADFETGSDELNEDESLILENLSTEPVQFDDLHRRTKIAIGSLSSALIVLELKGLLERAAGDRYRRAKRDDACSSFSEAQVMGIASALAFLSRTFDGVSRKYLQLHLADYWCYSDRVRWGIGSIMPICMRIGPIKREQILSYVSPLYLKVPKLKNMRDSAFA